MTHLNWRISIVVYFLFFLPALSAQTLQVINLDGHSTTLTAAQISSLPHVTVDARDHDGPAQFQGLPLSAILSSAGIQLGDSLHGTRMSEVLLVSAADGYKVAFALAEVDPAFAAREIILADKREGTASRRSQISAAIQAQTLTPPRANRPYAAPGCSCAPARPPASSVTPARA